MSDSLGPCGLSPARLLCPWDFPVKNTEVGCHTLLQGIFMIQGLNLCLCVSYITGRFFTAEPLGKSFYILYCIYFNAAAAAAKSLQLCLILCDPIDGSAPGSPVPGILQARTLEWVFQCYSLNFFHPPLLPLCPQVHSLCLHLYSCPANRFIGTVLYFLYQFIIKTTVASHSYPQFTI